MSTDPPHVDLAIDQATNDLYVESDGNVAFAVGARGVAQHVRARLMTFRGEWFLDIDAGVVWLAEIMAEQYNPALAEALVKSEVLDTPGVVAINAFSVGFDPRLRNLVIKEIEVGTEYDVEVRV